MKISKKFLYVGVIAIVVALIPYFTGHYIEIKYNDFIERISEFDGVELNTISYERKWGSSTAKTRVLLTQSAYVQLSRGIKPTHLTIDRLPDLTFVLEHTVKHGPYVKHTKGWQLARATVDSKLYLSPEAKKIIEAELGTSELINFFTYMDLFDGDIHIELDGTSFRTADQAQNEPDAWGGLKGTWLLNSSLTELSGEVVCPSFNLDIYDANYLGKDVWFKTERKRIDYALWEGKGQLQMQELRVNDPEDDVQLVARGTLASGMMSQENGLISSSGFVRLESLVDHENKLGPISFQVTVNRIPTNIFLMINQVMQSADSINTIASSLYSSPDFLSQVPQLLLAQPEIVINNVLIDSPDGAFTGEAGITIGGQGLSILKPEQVLASAIAMAEFQVPKKMLMRTMRRQHAQKNPELEIESARFEEDFEKTYADWISKWVGGGYLIDRGTHYGFKLDYRNGILTINGAVVPIE